MFKKEFIMLPEGNVFLWEESGKSHSQNQPNKLMLWSAGDND